MKSVAQRYQDFLQSLQLDSSLIERSEQFPFERILIVLGGDYRDRPIAMEAAFIDSAQLPALQHALAKQLIDYTYRKIQITYAFPFTVREEAFDDTVALVTFLNGLIDIPGLQFDLFEAKLYFRHPIFYGNTPLDEQSFLAILGMIALIVKLYGEPLELVASKKMTFDEILSKALEISERFKFK